MNTVRLASASVALVIVGACGRDTPREAAREVEQAARQEAMDERYDRGVAEPETLGARGEPGAQEDKPAVVRHAEAELKSSNGMSIDGDAELTESQTGVKIVLEVENAPSGQKGVHLHELGDCSDIKGKSMGAHFAPGGEKHALPSERAHGERHLGDLGNIQIDEKGNGRLEITVSGATLKDGDRLSLLGRAIVLHESRDLGASKQPSGASGDPMACGVIRAS
jgi:Cu-Zn family superoxide dismutase